MSKKIKVELNAIHFFVFIPILILFFINLVFFFEKPKLVRIVEIKDNSSSFISDWQTFLKGHPDYKEGWIELSKLDSKSANLSGSDSYMERAKQIDPNLEVGR